MMIKKIPITLFLFASLHGTAGDEALKEGRYKEAIACYSEEAAISPTSASFLSLAIAYHKDQEMQNALLAYLEALKIAEVKECEEQDRNYEEALAIYLNGQNPKQTAEEILKKYPIETISKEKKTALIVAAAVANLNRFSEFFPYFIAAYSCHPDHFLRYKIEAALHLKLHSCLRDKQKKEFHKTEALKLAKEALKREERDISLYKWLITLANKEKQADAVESCLQKIINDNIVVSRGDIAFFIQQAVLADKKPLAKRFLEKAKEWYAFSRVVTTAENYLEHLENPKGK